MSAISCHWRTPGTVCCAARCAAGCTFSRSQDSWRPDMDCENAFSWAHLLFEELRPNFLVFFKKSRTIQGKQRKKENKRKTKKRRKKQLQKVDNLFRFERSISQYQCDLWISRRSTASHPGRRRKPVPGYALRRRGGNGRAVPLAVHLTQRGRADGRARCRLTKTDICN